jgi:type IV secretory pathway VirB2 component (pilin)
MIISTKLFPSIMIVLNILAAGTYALHGLTEWRQIVYWLAAAVLTFVVTY